jgi:hypothetical protein
MGGEMQQTCESIDPIDEMFSFQIHNVSMSCVKIQMKEILSFSIKFNSNQMK